MPECIQTNTALAAAKQSESEVFLARHRLLSLIGILYFMGTQPVRHVFQH